MKIVLAVDKDKQTIVKRTGRAAFFAIYEDENIFEFIENSHGYGEYGEGEHHKHSHEDMEHAEHTNEHKKDVAGLKGCDIFLLQAVGENMKEALESVGVEIKKVRKKDGITADEVVRNFLAGNI